MTDSENTTAERWRAIPGYESRYAVSDQGRIRRTTNRKGEPHIPKLLKGTDTGHGYLCVGLYKGTIPKLYQIHRLVLAAFIGPCPEGKETNHKNGDKKDNSLENLEYVTRKENIHHARYVLGLQIGDLHWTKISPHLIRRGKNHWTVLHPEQIQKMPRGERNANAKLTAQIVLEIRKRYANGGISQPQLSRIYGVRQSAIWGIVNRKSWKHI